YHAGGQLAAPCWRELSRADLRGDRVGADRGERVDVLWICGAAGAARGRGGDGGGDAAVVVFAGMHRCADFVEWGERAAEDCPLRTKFENRNWKIGERPAEGAEGGHMGPPLRCWAGGEGGADEVGEAGNEFEVGADGRHHAELLDAGAGG